MTDDLVRSLRNHRVLVIFRGHSTGECVELAHALYDAGVRLFEVTLNSERPYDAIAALRAELGDQALVGAGTVLTPSEVKAAADAGAQLIVSPNLDEAVVAQTKTLGLGSVPGAFSPTEVVRAAQQGADLVKVFPIGPVGADFIRQLRAPLPDIPFMATGGVDARLAAECVAAGADSVGVGTHLLGAADGVDAAARGARRLIEATGAVRT